jgi:hypothetical protein
MSNFRDFWATKSHISRLIFVLIILYCVSSITVLLLALGILPYVSDAHLNPFVLIGFAIASFTLTLFISAFHLSTMLRRRKRKTDHQ